jgi:hypothetical protein
VKLLMVAGLLFALISWLAPDLRTAIFKGRGGLIPLDYIPRTVGTVFYLTSAIFGFASRTW